MNDTKIIMIPLIIKLVIKLGWVNVRLARVDMIGRLGYSEEERVEHIGWST